MPVEALRCPICKAIFITEAAKDGDLYTCHYCSYRFTVTAVRRYFLYQEHNGGGIELQNIEKLVKTIDNSKLIEISKFFMEEIESRFNK